MNEKRGRTLQNKILLDINEDDIKELDKRLLKILLIDRTTQKNILWGTDDYLELGSEYEAGNEILEELITGKQSRIIQPRIAKAKKQKKDRTRQRAEGFTPSWVCNAQNNLVDEQWFGGEQQFNVTSGEKWISLQEPIRFAEKGAKTWKKYVDAKRLEITCGEAPYIASRYDSVTGKTIPVSDRIGLLDRKLRVVGENTESIQDWMFWAKRAIESVYGYEFHGDSLLLARENVLYTYIEFFKDRFKVEPEIKNLKEIAHVISWNLWQMDGFNYAIPYCKVESGPRQMSIFDFMDEEDMFDYKALTDTKGQKLCKIRDWRSKETILYRDLLVEEVK